MGKSSIAKHFRVGAGSEAALEIGRRVRERRLAVGLTQAELAVPLSKGFVSAVEKGHTLPSLGALWLFASRLGIDVGSLVDHVNSVGTLRYNASYGNTTDSRRRAHRHEAQATPHRR